MYTPTSFSDLCRLKCLATRHAPRLSFLLAVSYAALNSFGLLLFSGCDFPEPPKAVSISDPAEIRPTKPSDITTPEDAMGTVMTISRKDLHLPGPDRVKLFLYKNSASFASYGQGWSSFPIDVDNITAFTRGSEIHIDLGKTRGQPWGQLIEILAHEYGHAIQDSLRNRSPLAWFNEGFAGWIAAKVLDSSGWQPYDVALERARIELVNDYDNLKGLRDLDWQWKALRENPKGHLETYVLGFFATARLLDRQSVPAATQYMKTRDFQKSFNMTVDAFADDFAAYLSSNRALQKTDVSPTIHKPDWKLGDQWTYAVKYPGDEPMQTHTIIREEKFEDAPSYVIKAGNRELYYSKETLERVSATKDGHLSSKRFTPSRQFSWPLTFQKQWQNKYSWRDFTKKSDYEVNQSLLVSEIGEVTVPAGKFLAARILAFHSRTGRLLSEYWYSPVTRSVIKLRDYSDVAFREEELTSFTIH